MKFKHSLLFGALALGLLTVAGCGTPSFKKLDEVLLTPTDWVTNHVAEKVEVYQTNRAVVVSATNWVSGDVTYTTNRETVSITNITPAHDVVTPVGWKPNETTAAVVSGVGSMIPGYGAIASTAFVGALALWAHLRSRRYRNAAISIAQGVEHYATTHPKESEDLKVVLAAVQEVHGTSQTVSGILEKDVESAPKTSP